MPVQANVTFKFQSPDGGFTPAYEVLDEPVAGIRMWFMCATPGGGNASNYSIILTDAEVAAVVNAAGLKTLVETKLGRKLRATNIASKLDSLIGQSVGPL